MTIDTFAQIVKSIKQASYWDAEYEPILDEWTSGLLPCIDRHPAARSQHHAYEGGLLDHTADMFILAKTWADNLTASDLLDSTVKDLADIRWTPLLIAILYHDIDKLLEYIKVDAADKPPTYEFTIIGSLIGHITLTALRFERFRGQVPTLKCRLLQHLVLSHHGIREWGSPIQPCVKEAVILHHLDMISMQVNKMVTVGHTKKLKDDKLGYMYIGPEYCQ